MEQSPNLDELFFFNGIDAATGNAAIAPQPLQNLIPSIRQAELPDDLKELEALRQHKEPHYGLKSGLDPKDLAQAGWGLICAEDVDPAILRALEPLIAWRREQTRPDRHRVISGADGIRAGESKRDFLKRHNIGPGPVNPEKMPYYLLLVGDLSSIGWTFQYQLDVQYAVGRIWFDTPEDFARYAQSVVAAERDGLALNRRIAFFGPDYDESTELSRVNLVEPLHDYLAKSHPDLELTKQVGTQATKAALAELLGGAETPALVFSASHGEFFSPGQPLQREHMGAVHCQDPGGHDLRAIRSGALRKYYFSGDDLDPDARLHGLIAFFFGCYSAGTPARDSFARYDRSAKRIDSETSLRQGPQAGLLSDTPFLAALPSGLLSHRRGGALAVIGNVDRTWSFSFRWGRAGFQRDVFESALDQLIAGSPIGSAMEAFNERYAELAVELAAELDDIDHGKRVAERELARLWAAHNDARGYVVLGDPAVRLPLAKPDTAPTGRKPLQFDEAKMPAFDSSSPSGPEPIPAAIQHHIADSSDTTEEGEDFEEFTFSTRSALSDSQPPPTSTSSTTLVVTTYIGGNDPDPSEKSKVVARTRMDATGNVENWLPDPEHLDATAWQAHRDVLALALRHRRPK
ncbi:Peptidase-C25 domain-containing protein [Sulfidibacter corallicola]|uniref:Gingipain domain-containing protein n=1 Tax=Sulfidibacter corallicola TaxID=2818388 RepID=A0A8A4TWK3_SULCO|nr:C25 family cysteine peptidase [Sulfidibacter corallicola]QTD53504.1 hypothetical protein J3U87_13700 [Sulfidibacter corallicola]